MKRRYFFRGDLLYCPFRSLRQSRRASHRLSRGRISLGVLDCNLSSLSLLSARGLSGLRFSAHLYRLSLGRLFHLGGLHYSLGGLRRLLRSLVLLRHLGCRLARRSCLASLSLHSSWRILARRCHMRRNTGCL
jgi:hypothetical protein